MGMCMLWSVAGLAKTRRGKAGKAEGEKGPAAPDRCTCPQPSDNTSRLPQIVRLRHGQATGILQRTTKDFLMKKRIGAVLVRNTAQLFTRFNAQTLERTKRSYGPKKRNGHCLQRKYWALGKEPGYSRNEPRWQGFSTGVTGSVS